MGITVVLGRCGIPSVADQNFVTGYVDHPQHFKQLGDFANLPMIYFHPTALVCHACSYRPVTASCLVCGQVNKADGKRTGL